MVSTSRQDHSTSFGKRLELLRRRARLTQDQLSQKAGLSRNYVGMLEHGRRGPSVDTVLRLMKAMDIADANLFVMKDVDALAQTAEKPSQQEKACQHLQRLLRQVDSEQLVPVVKAIGNLIKAFTKKGSGRGAD